MGRRGGSRGGRRSGRGGRLREVALVRGRCRLKGSGKKLFDVLTAEERRIHQRLLPRYHREVAAGSTAQFHRARLFVNHREAF